MKKLTILLSAALAMTPALLAESPMPRPGMEARSFSVALSPSKEVPPVVGAMEMGSSTIQFNVHRGMDGMVDMVIVDFRVNYTLGSEQTIRAMHIHKAPAGMNGGVVINSNFGAPVTAPASSGSFFRHTIVNDPMGLEAVMDIMKHPEMYYLNIHTAANPGGHIRGQLSPLGAAERLAVETNRYVKMNSMKLDHLDGLIRTVASGLGVTLPPPPAPVPPAAPPTE